MKLFSLKNVGVFRVSGKDARRYLNSRLSSDIRGLVQGESCLAAMLSPQGRAEGFFSVRCLNDEEFLLLSDAGGADAVSLLKKFLAADRVAVSDETSQSRVFHVDCMPKDLGPEYGLLFASARTGPGSLDIVCAGGGAVDQRLVGLGFEPLSEAEFEYLRRASGRPAFPSEINNEGLFYEAGMRSAVSFNKGCYVGQEVNERIDSHGRTARRMMRLRTAAGLIAGEEVSLSAEGGAQFKAKVLSAAWFDSKTAAFVMVKNDLPTETGVLSLNGARAELLPVEAP